MKKFFIGLVLLMVVLSSVIRANEPQGGAKLEQKKIAYQVMWNTTNVIGTIYVNDFEVTKLRLGGGTGTASLNVWLTGQNQLRVELQKKDPAEPADFSLGVSEVLLGQMVDTREEGNLASIKFTEEDFAAAKTVKASREFNSTFDFSEHLTSTKEAAEEKEVLEYAARIYRLFEKKDAKNILKEFSVKLDDYAKAFYEKDISAPFESFLKEDLFKSKLTKVDPKNLKAVQTGNLWHILDGDKELLRTSSEGGSTGEMAVYVGMVGGELKVIR